MTDFTRINEKRVDKIYEILGMIDKSARSQGAGPKSIRTLLEPATNYVAELTDGSLTAAAPDPGEAEVVSSPPVRREAGPIDPLAFVRNLTTRQQLDIIGVLATELEYKLWETEKTM